MQSTSVVLYFCFVLYICVQATVLLQFLQLGNGLHATCITGFVQLREGLLGAAERLKKKKEKEICHGEILSSTGHTKTGKGIVCQISSLLYLAETLMPPFFGLHFPSSCFLDSDSPRKTEKVTCRLSSSCKFKGLRQKFTHEASPVQWPFEH